MHHKVKRLLPVLLVLIVLCLVIVKVAEARRWVGDNGLRWTIEDEKVCRDGVVILAYDIHSSIPPGEPGWMEQEPYPHQLFAIVYETTATKSPDDDGHGNNPQAYGPRLSTTQEFMLDYHIDESGEYVPLEDPERGNHYLYHEGKLTWPRALPVGAKILVYSLHNNLTLDGEVQDCYLNLLTTPLGGSVIIDNQHLYADTGIMDQSDAIFRLDAPPTHGTLKLNGAPLQAGDQFTQHDIDNGLLRYNHNASGVTEDSFDYTLLSSTRRLSSGSSGTNGNKDSFDPSISAAGQFVTFASDATNLVDGDLNGFSDIFYRDLYTSETIIISLNTNNALGNGGSFGPAISGEGRMVVFGSNASNLVIGDSTASCPSRSDSNNLKDIFGVDITYNEDGSLDPYGMERISIEGYSPDDCIEANGESSQAAISERGAIVVFTSEANNLEPNDNNSAADIFMNGSFQVSPISTNQANQVGNGRSAWASIRSNPDPYSSYNDYVVAFQSLAYNLLSGTSDTNGVDDIFVRHVNGVVVRASVSSSGAQADGHSYTPSVSAGGRFVAFMSDATNLTTGDTNGMSDIFLRDRDTDEDGLFDEAGAVSTTLVSSAVNGGPANGASSEPHMSANGRYIAFSSLASNLVSGDTNGVEDVFVYDRQLDKMTRVSIASDGSQGNGESSRPSISDDGDYVAFQSYASNLSPNDTNGKSDIFVHYAGFSATFPLGITQSGTVYFPTVLDVNDPIKAVNPEGN